LLDRPRKFDRLIRPDTEPAADGHPNLDSLES
jgi:hypothetical protein